MDGVAAGVDGYADEAADEHYGDEKQQYHKDNKEPRELVEHLAEFADDVLLIGHAGDTFEGTDLGTEVVKHLCRVVGQETDVEVDHQRGVEGIVAYEAHEVLAEILGEYLGGLGLGDIVDVLDVGHCRHGVEVGEG